MAQTQIGADIDGEFHRDRSGTSLSLSDDGRIVAIGAPGNRFLTNTPSAGHVRVYQYLSGAWTQIGSDIDGKTAYENSGNAVSLSHDGRIVAVGASGYDDNEFDNFENRSVGNVRIYKNISGIWTQIGSDIKGKAKNDFFGYSVCLSANGKIVAIAGIINDNHVSGPHTGYVSIYENLSGTWTQIGSDINGEASGNGTGRRERSMSLSKDGRVVAIGNERNGDNGLISGYVRIYQNLSGIWTQIGSDINGEAAGDLLGTSVSLSAEGSIVAIGAGAFNPAGNSTTPGYVKVYENLSGVWTQIGNNINGEAAADRSGISVSLSEDGNIVAIGADANDGNGDNSGHVRVYQNLSGIWTQIGSDIDGEAIDDHSGRSLNLNSDGSIVAIAGLRNNGNGIESGHVRIFYTNNTLGIQDNLLADIVAYVPSPNRLRFKELPTGKTYFKLFNTLGQEVVNTTFESTGTQEITLPYLTKGVYIIKLNTESGLFNKKIILE